MVYRYHFCQSSTGAVQQHLQAEQPILVGDVDQCLRKTSGRLCTQAPAAVCHPSVALILEHLLCEKAKLLFCFQ